MNRDELNSLLLTKKKVPHISGLSLYNREPRTFLLSVNSDQSVTHVYFDKDSVLHKLTYIGNASSYEVIEHKAAITFPTVDILPLESSFLMAGNCDFDFCKLIFEQGFSLSFHSDHELKAEALFLDAPF